MNMSCLQPFLVLSLAAMSRKKEKEDVDMEEEEEEEEWEEDEPWRNSKGRKSGGGTTSWARQARRAAKQSKRVVMSTGKPLEKGTKPLQKGHPLRKGTKPLQKGHPLRKGTKPLQKGNMTPSARSWRTGWWRASTRGSLVPGWKLAHPLRKGQLQAAAMLHPLGKGQAAAILHPLKKGKKNFLKKGRHQPLNNGNSLKKEMLPKRWQFWSQRLPPTSRQNSCKREGDCSPWKRVRKEAASWSPIRTFGCVGWLAPLPEKWSPGHCAGPGPHGPAEAPWQRSGGAFALLLWGQANPQSWKGNVGQAPRSHWTTSLVGMLHQSHWGGRQGRVCHRVGLPGGLWWFKGHLARAGLMGCQNLWHPDTQREPCMDARKLQVCILCRSSEAVHQGLQSLRLLPALAKGCSAKPLKKGMALTWQPLKKGGCLAPILAKG